MSSNYFLVDYENVHSSGLKNIPGIGKNDTVIIFYSKNCKTVTLDVFNDIENLNLNFGSKKVNAGTKNALDFQLSSYLGYLISGEKEKNKYHIVSNDKGYEAVASFWQAENVCVDCISVNTNKSESNTAIKSTPAKSSSNVATIEEIKECIGNKNNPEAVLKIFNSCKSKQALNNALTKHYKDNNKASKVYKKLKPLFKKKYKS